jgi:hypothetical protein
LEDNLYPLQLYREENSKVLVSVLIDIAYNNPRTYPAIVAILSKILSLEVDSETVKTILNFIERKFDKIPNVGHLQIWLQRLTIKTDRNKNYTEKLCQKVNDSDTEIWNTDWLTKSINSVFACNPIIDEDKIDEVPQIIEPDEVKVVFGY